MISLHKVFAILVGCLLISFGIDFFLIPNKVLDGGFIGLALIANYVFGVKVGVVLLLCSTPVFLYTWFVDKSIFLYSLLGMAFLSYFIDLFAAFQPWSYHIHAHPYFSSVAAGLIIGLGFGILLRFDTSSGGMDLLAKLLASRIKINVGVLILVMDAVVIAIGGILFSLDTLFLSIATISAGGLATSLCTLKIFGYD